MPKDLSGAQVGMSPQNNVNNPRPNNMRGRNEFPQTYMMLTTDRFGEWSPFFWAKCERGDVQNLHSVHNLHTFTLKTPMVSKVNMVKSYVKVPMQAIYPRNWEKMMTIPTQGDDVPSDTRALFDITKFCQFVFSSRTYGNIACVKSFILLESVLSHGSLFERFNMHLNGRFSVRSESTSLSVDEYMDKYFWPKVIELGYDYYLSDDYGNFYYIGPTDGSIESYPNHFYVSPHRYIEMLRSNEFTLDPNFDGSSFYDDVTLPDYLFMYSSGSLSQDPSERYLNIEPIIAYQLSCSQFATNDFVDFIYSAQLYRDNMQSIMSKCFDYDSDHWPTFRYNGVDYQYDVFSGYVLNRFIDGHAFDYIDEFTDFFINLFQYQRSLRYGDYFTGGKPRPLAVGEYSAQVNNNEVSAIDITRSIQMQRLLNRVNMVGRKLSDYLAGIFGGKLPEAPKDVPIFLARQRFNVDGFEVNNTGADQLSDDVNNITTTNLRTAEDRFAFEIEIDEPCYILGMNSYESMRIYSKTMDRFAFHHDRYDDFIPEMQYIGDQDIKAVELDSSVQHQNAYAYALRYMEYKQRYSYASGGFIENLPSWAFITDNKDGNLPQDRINPDYIRSSPSEFDRFYKSLNGYSLGSYFHFILCHTNITSPSRMMEYTPEILK